MVGIRLRRLTFLRSGVRAASGDGLTCRSAAHMEVAGLLRMPRGPEAPVPRAGEADHADPSVQSSVVPT
jgi:hypothetical protein